MPLDISDSGFGEKSKKVPWTGFGIARQQQMYPLLELEFLEKI